MLTFEINTDGTINIFLDHEGRDQLIRSLSRLTNPGDHDHLMTPSHAGYELTEIPQGPSGSRLIHVVTVGIPHKIKE